MHDLVTLSPTGQAVTTSLVIAEGTENEHRAVLQLIRTHQQDLEDFGRVAFEMQPFETAGGVQSREVAILNQEQATLLLTHMRSIGVVKEFKKALVKAFFALARQAVVPFVPRTLPEALRLAADLEEKRASLACRVIEQEEDIAVLEPKAAFADAVARAEDAHTVLEAAKILGTGQNRMFDWLVENHFIFRVGTGFQVYQPHLDAGLFKVVENHFEDRHGRDRIHAKVLITGKGMVALQRRMAAAKPEPLVRPQHDTKAS